MTTDPGRAPETEGTHFAALVLDARDDVAVALRDLVAGDIVTVLRGGARFPATIAEPIPLGHKLALHAIGRGDAIRKYGELIGRATADIGPGMHVHVHNLASTRGRTAT